LNSNSRRIFESILSVDAWRTAFSEQEKVASVHVDVSFFRGKLGDDPSSPVRFEIALRRAEIVFVIPANEPLRVSQPSVLREPPIQVKTRFSKKVENEAVLSGSAGLDIANRRIEMTTRALGTRKNVQTHQQEYELQDSTITWAQSKTSDGYYRWEVAPSMAPYLLGKVWDAVSQPILSLRNKNIESKIDCVSRIEVYCRREDLLITNLSIKTEGRFSGIFGQISDRKKAAAEAYIRNALASRDLDIKNFEDPYGTIMLADVIVEDQS